MESAIKKSEKEIFIHIKKLHVWDIPFSEGYIDGVKLKDLLEIFGIKHQESNIFKNK